MMTDSNRAMRPSTHCSHVHYLELVVYSDSDPVAALVVSAPR
jgi:hypothetical protein